MNRPWKIGSHGCGAIMLRSVVQIMRRPLMWIGMLGLPLFLMLFITSMFEKGLPTKIPAAIIDKDCTAMSRGITQNLADMQLVDLKYAENSYSDARKLMQEGKIYGYFLIPENFEADMLAGRGPSITFYTNMVYYVPGTLLFKTFKSAAIYTKIGIMADVAQAVGQNTAELAPLVQPVNIVTRPIGNPLVNYGIYLSNSFVPCAIQLMIMLITCFSLGQEIKYGTSPHLMQMARGSVVRAVYAKIFPQTVIWWVVVLFMTAWLYKFCGYTMSGSWGWLILSELLFVMAAQGFAIFVFCVLPNLRLSLSVCALTGILSFSLAAFSFPEQSMYPAMSIFSWLMPIRYNFLIYSDIALNGRDFFYSRIWFAAYIGYIILPFTMLWKLKGALLKPVYAP